MTLAEPIPTNRVNGRVSLNNLVFPVSSDISFRNSNILLVLSPFSAKLTYRLFFEPFTMSSEYPLSKFVLLLLFVGSVYCEIILLYQECKLELSLND